MLWSGGVSLSNPWFWVRIGEVVLIIALIQAFLLYRKARKAGKINKLFDQKMLRSPEFAAKQKAIYSKIDKASGLVAMQPYSNARNGRKEQWHVSRDSIKIMNWHKKKGDLEIPFSEISKLEIDEVRNHWIWGESSILRIWRKGSSKRGGDRKFICKPFAMEAVEEVKRRYEAYGGKSGNP